MALGEFDLIKKYFTAHDSGEGITLGIGDDCALFSVPSEMELAVTTDTQIEGIHFFPGTSPYYLGYKSLLVNLSDLAAMGARPYCFTLSLTLPDSNEEFLSEFSRGLFELCAQHSLPLIGGNTAKGPLSITISAYGLVEKGTAMRRDMARDGDDIYVTGNLGLSALAVDLGYQKLSLGEGAFDYCYEKSMLIPSRCLFASDLKNISRCALDISDGLIGDLGHIMERSNLGAHIALEEVPAADELYSYGLDEDYIHRLCLFGGGDYELLFTLDPKFTDRLLEISKRHNVRVSRIGNMKKGELTLTNHDRIVNLCDNSFQHF